MSNKKKSSTGTKKTTTLKTFQNALRAAESRVSGQIVNLSQSRHTTFAGGIPLSTEYSILPRHAPLVLENPTHPPVANTVEPIVLPTSPNVDEPPPKTQASQFLQEFLDIIPQIGDLLLEHDANPFSEDDCPCGRNGAKRTTTCRDCTMYSPLCPECFIDAHHCNPTHWAEVWDPSKGFFQRHDISAIREGGYAIHFGHGGLPCPHPWPRVHFNIIDTNGIHNTLVHFCGCPHSLLRDQQLFKMGLFPATLRRPEMAFTFRVLHHFHLLHLESKTAAYDFVGTLRRITDNAFAQHTSNPYSEFCRVMRVWRYVQATKRLGQFHGIDILFPKRPGGNLLVYCPACPEPGVNMQTGWENTPEHLSHLNSLQQTIDGNFHANKYIKNTDPDDISLFQGKAYFPDDHEFRDYLRNLPAGDVLEEKSTCTHLNAVNKQNRRKFKNMDITGIINVQCRHVFIQSTCDLQLGERFANTDYALAHAIRQRQIHYPNLDDVAFANQCLGIIKCDTSYDISCAYWINVVKRFEANFPDLVGAIKQIRWLIPLVHVQNHKDNCTYLFSSAYKNNAGHFHGETSEHAWPEINQLGGQTRQMNNGHRQDTLIDHHGDWNFKKTANLAATLYTNLQKSKALFDQKRAAFMSLCELYSSKVALWNKQDRDLRRIDSDKEVVCVYRQSQKKVPSLSNLYQMLMSELDSQPKSAISETSTSSSDTKIASFLHEALLIQAEQRKLQSKVKSNNGGQTSINLRPLREELRTRIDKWRRDQKHVMPQVGDYVIKQSTHQKTEPTPETETLYIPSDFSEAERLQLQLVTLGEHERRLQGGAAYDTIRRVRTTCKTITSLHSNKKAQAYGQTRHTRAAEQIRTIEGRRELYISDYAIIRGIMISLGLPEDSAEFPPLTVADTYRKPTNIKRAVGDSQRHDGALWTNTGITAGVRPLPRPAVVISKSAASVGTQSSRLKRRAPPIAKGPKGKSRRLNPVEGENKGTYIIWIWNTIITVAVDQRESGWIWALKAGGELSNKELEEWTSEGDRVQWFRAEAEMQRWQEEWEKTIAEFLRTISFFESMRNAWKTLSTSDTHAAGARAYSSKKAAMYARFHEEAQDIFARAKSEDLLRPQDGENLIDYVERERDVLDTALRKLIPDATTNPESEPVNSDNDGESPTEILGGSGSDCSDGDSECSDGDW